MIHIFDMNYVEQPHAIAVFLVETSAGPVLVETGPHSTFPQLKTAVASKGYKMSDIRHVFITHIHLDHAGAAWAMAKKVRQFICIRSGIATCRTRPNYTHPPNAFTGMIWIDSGAIYSRFEAQLRVVDHGEKNNGWRSDICCLSTHPDTPFITSPGSLAIRCSPVMSPVFASKMCWCNRPACRRISIWKIGKNLSR
ncbi:MAG: MBL fold metallo-hydrolase [Calditrichia bacterium]